MSRPPLPAFWCLYWLYDVVYCCRYANSKDGDKKFGAVNASACAALRNFWEHCISCYQGPGAFVFWDAYQGLVLSCFGCWACSEMVLPRLLRCLGGAHLLSRLLRLPSGCPRELPLQVAFSKFGAAAWSSIFDHVAAAWSYLCAAPRNFLSGLVTTFGDFLFNSAAVAASWVFLWGLCTAIGGPSSLEVFVIVGGAMMFAAALLLKGMVLALTAYSGLFLWLLPPWSVPPIQAKDHARLNSKRLLPLPLATARRRYPNDIGLTVHLLASSYY